MIIWKTVCLTDIYSYYYLRNISVWETELIKYDFIFGIEKQNTSAEGEFVSPSQVVQVL